MTAELVGRVGRLKGLHPPDEQGLTLTLKVLTGSTHKANAIQRCTACALTADALGLVTASGAVYAVHLKQQRYKCLDTLESAGTAAAFMTRLSRRLFIGCSNGDIYCYDYSTNSRLARLPGHRTALSSLSTKSDTEQLLSASADAVLLWDMQTFRQRRMLSSAPYGSSQAAFSPAGNILIAAAGSEGQLIVWHAKSLHEICRLPIPLDKHQRPFVASCLSISLDERWLLVGCRSPALLLLYNLEQQCLQHALQLPEDMYGIIQVQLLPDSTSAAVLSSNGCISFLDTQSCSFTGQLQLTSAGCRATSFSIEPRANSIAVTCNDGMLRLYDLAAVRAKQQKQPAPVMQQPVHKANELQLQHLTGGTGSQVIRAGVTDNAVDSARNQQQPLQVLSEVSNIPAKKKVVGKGSQSKSSSDNKLQTQHVDAPAAMLNRKKLQQLLAVYGEFPAKYRAMIWEHLLQLPHNSAAFTLLQDRGVHPAYKDLAQQMPGGSRSILAVRLQACLSQLAHWCPLFGEAGFLPRFAFPFVKVCGAKAESAFEMVATLLLNWCKGWFELFPNPPLPLLRRFLLMLSQHDLELGSHLQHLGVPLLQQLWHQMSGAMSDLLPTQSDWLVFWDQCLAAAAGPAFYYQLLCAYLIAQRRSLLAVQDEQQLTQLWESTPAVDIHQVVKQAYKLQENTPDYALIGLKSFSALPAADDDGSGYPMFSEYPAGSVEVQALERRRIQEAEDALIRRRQVVAELEQRSKQVAFDSAALTAQRQQLAALDSHRRAAMRAIDDSLAAAGARLDDRSKEEKLKQIRLVEEAYQASLASLRTEWTRELTALKADVEHKRRLAAAALKARQEEEDLKALEFQAQQRLWALQQEEMAAAGTSALHDAAAAQDAALRAEQQRKAAEWQAEDEVRVLRQQHEAARRARLVAAAEQEAAKQAAKGLLLTQELQAQQELLKVEHQRRLRQLAEDEAEITAKQVQLQAERQAVLTAAGQQAVQQQAQQQKARFTEEQQQRMGAVDEELQALKQRQAELHAAAAEIGSAARMAAAEHQLSQLEQAISGARQEEENRVQQILKELNQDKEAHDHVMSVLSTVRADPGRPPPPPAGAAGRTDQQAGAAAGAASSSSAADLEARLAALTADIQAEAAAATAQATKELAPASVRAADSSGSDLAELHERLARLGARAAEGSTPDGGSMMIGTEQAGAPAQRRLDGSTESIESLVRQVERMNLQHALRTAQATLSAGQSAAESAARQPSPAASSSTSSSISVSQELEQLLAETEAEVQRELAFKAAAEARLKAKQQLRQQTVPPLRASAAARLQPVPEEPSHSGSTASPAAAAAARPAGRLPGSVTHSPVSCPATSVASSPSKRPIMPSGLGPRAAGPVGAVGGPRPGSSSGRMGGGDAVGSPAAVKLALSGLEPLTHHGRVVRGLADVLKQHAGQPTTSGSSSGSSDNAKQQQQQQQQQQQRLMGAQRRVEAQHSPETPASTASLLTASSGSILTGSPADSNGVRTRTPPAPPSALIAPAAAAVLRPGLMGDDAGQGQGAGSSTYSLYEPVLLGAPERPTAPVRPAAQGAGGALISSLSASPSSTQGSSSQPSSKSLSLGRAAAADMAGQLDRETPTLGHRTRARTMEGDQSALSGFATAVAQGAGSMRNSVSSTTSSSSSSGSDAGSLGAPLLLGGGQAAGSSRLGSRASSGRLQRGLDASGRVSAELRQSSSATSEELESLLQQLAQYEERLLETEPSTSALQLAPAAEGASEMGTSMSSVSWSQTLAGLASLLPQEQ